MINDKRNLKKFIFSNIDFNNISRILDLGCGNGDDMKLLLELHPENTFEITAADKIENSIGDERIKYEQKDLNGCLNFKSNSFDLVYSHNFFECISDRELHINELYRILRPGGLLVYSHTDWDSQILDAENKDLVRKVLEAYAEWKQPWMDDIDSWLGRRLNGIFNSSKKFKGETKSFTIINTKFSEGLYSYNMINSFLDMTEEKLITIEEFNELMGQIETLNDAKKFFYSITSFIYYGVSTKEEGDGYAK